METAKHQAKIFEFPPSRIVRTIEPEPPTGPEYNDYPLFKNTRKTEALRFLQKNYPGADGIWMIYDETYPGRGTPRRGYSVKVECGHLKEYAFSDRNFMHAAEKFVLEFGKGPKKKRT